MQGLISAVVNLLTHKMVNSNEFWENSLWKGIANTRNT